MAAIKLRFVTTSSPLSAAIRFAEDYRFSHVDAVTDNGYLGAHADGGVLERPFDYDKGSWTAQAFWSLSCSDLGLESWQAYLRGRIGRPYDFAAILGFVLRDGLHDKLHVICSALQTMALREIGVFGFPLAVPAHETSPRDLAMMCTVLAPLGPMETAA